MMTIQQAISKDNGYATTTMYVTIMIVLDNQLISQWEA
jgi:hypothetical protein